MNVQLQDSISLTWDELFWFGKPKLVLWLIHMISFQNAFEMASFLWSLAGFQLLLQHQQKSTLALMILCCRYSSCFRRQSRKEALWVGLSEVTHLVRMIFDVMPKHIDRVQPPFIGKYDNPKQRTMTQLFEVAQEECSVLFLWTYLVAALALTGDQSSPGVIPLAIKDVFSMIEDVIGKLSEGKASHVPYRDSKLTRLLQSSLSGHGHVSVITPASSNMEETHNTLKFASRAKRVEIYASRNKCFFEKILFQIIDEKSLIKKYQREISVLKQELDQLKKGMIVGVNHDEILTLRQNSSSIVDWIVGRRSSENAIKIGGRGGCQGGSNE
ncbi:kinesin-like protein kin-7d [Quercus suber]|uniref:Kinesin-like protein kin-7d n=1 Tax=Quercus suber TaxID=58331 RepID=A0AAW0JCV4_QUESU